MFAAAMIARAPSAWSATCILLSARRTTMSAKACGGVELLDDVD
jgi:hypothetical protein